MKPESSTSKFGFKEVEAEIDFLCQFCDLYMAEEPLRF